MPSSTHSMGALINLRGYCTPTKIEYVLWELSFKFQVILELLNTAISCMFCSLIQNCVVLQNFNAMFWVSQTILLQHAFLIKKDSFEITYETRWVLALSTVSALKNYHAPIMPDNKYTHAILKQLLALLWIKSTQVMELV